jgi:hypothetical protein
VFQIKNLNPETSKPENRKPKPEDGPDCVVQQCLARALLSFLGFGFRVSGSRAHGFEFRVSGFGFRISYFWLRVSGFKFLVSGFGFLVSGFWFRISGF